MGRFTMAAKHHQSIAEMYESEAVDLERAVHHYEQAADYFRGEESNSSANKCLLKVAQYAAQLENYEKAIQIYEQVILPKCLKYFFFHLLLLMLIYFWVVFIFRSLPPPWKVRYLNTARKNISSEQLCVTFALMFSMLNMPLNDMNSNILLSKILESINLLR